MARLDFLAPASSQYPAGGGQTSSASCASPSGDSWIDRLFAPSYIAYPAPQFLPQQQDCQPAQQAPVASTAAIPAAPASSALPAATSAALPAAATAPAPSPVTVVIQPWPGAASAPTTAETSAAPALSSSPVATPPVLPVPAPSVAAAPVPVTPPAPVVTQSKILRAFVFNPEFVERERTAQEEYLEDEIGEELADEITSRMVSRDATPVAFVVPDGCDSLDILFGPIAVNPGCGSDDDLKEVVTVGEAKLGANVCGIDGPLTPGDQVIVTVPWRAASWVDLPESRLRMPVIVHFYKSTDE